MNSVMKKTLVAALLCGAATLAGGELFARYALGLGTPPLSTTHPTIEYLFIAQDVRRFGNRFLSNEYGMRNGKLSPTPAPEETRVLVYGDSVLNGGALTAHDDLATTSASLRQTLRQSRPVLYLNISAGSWGPGNQLAHMKEFGLFGARTAIVVLSAHDASDEPDFAPLDPTTHPMQAPWSALAEGVTRYVPRYLPRYLPRYSPTYSPAAAGGAREGFLSEKSLHGMLDLLAAADVSVCFMIHATRLEYDGQEEIGRAELMGLAATRGVPTIDLRDYYRSEGVPLRLYLDDIHINQAGQRALARALDEAVEKEACRRPRATGQ